MFARLYDEVGTPPEQARLPIAHSEESVSVLDKIAAQSRKLGDMKDDYFITIMFDETATQRDGTIRRETRYPKGASEWILSGPHFFVGTPFYKTPNEGCSTNRDYSEIDLSAIPDDYLPRTNFVPACSPDEYRRRTPSWKGTPVTERYRLVSRAMVAPSGERTLISAIMPPESAHLDGGISMTFLDDHKLVIAAWLFASLPLDFFIRSSGKTHFRRELADILPWPNAEKYAECAVNRVLRLNCLTVHYAPLWESA